MRKVSTHVKDKYGYDTGSFTDFPADESNLKILARLDWNITDKHHLALRYNYTNNTAWNGPNATSMDGGTRSAYGRASLYSMVFANSMYSMNNLVHSVSLDLNSRLTVSTIMFSTSRTTSFIMQETISSPWVSTMSIRWLTTHI